MKIRLILTTLIFSVLLASCSSNSDSNRELLTQEQRTQEIEKITNVIKMYNQANNARNWADMVKTLDKEVTFFGSDKGEKSKDMAAFKETIKKQWENYSKMEYGDMQDIYVELDDYANFANIIFGVPLEAVANTGEKENLFVIVQRTLKKDPISKKWVICSGIVSIPRAAETTINEEKN